MPATVSADTGRAAQDAARSVAGVAGLHAGAFGEVALLLPGERINGIAPVRDAANNLVGLELHLVVDISAGRPVVAIANDVRAAVRTATGFERIDITVADAVSGREGAGGAPQLD